MALPRHASHGAIPAKSRSLQRRRFWLRSAFFALFVIAPPLDWLRFDLTLGHAYFLGVPWTLGIDAFVAGEATPAEVAVNLTLRGFLPIFGGAAVFIYLSWRYGRLYCGWLCPHFSVVELVNGLMRRATGRLSLWDEQPLPERDPDGRTIHPDAKWWPVTFLAIGGFGFLWALVLLTYLLPPAEVYGNLWHGTLTRNQLVFVTAGTIVFILEFLLARHLFCRFGCAVGLFQSLAWMANPRALVIDFDARRARACAECNSACENACPMRLKPRDIKRRMFTCTQCTNCVDACDEVQSERPEGGLLRWVTDGQITDKQRRGIRRSPSPPQAGNRLTKGGAKDATSRQE